MRRLTIVSQWYPPEQAPFGRMMHELATRLAAAGWDVTVVTAFPNHPSGIVHEGYRKKWVQEERQAGVRVLRVWLATSKRRTLLARLATFVTFTMSASWRLLRDPRPDIVFAVLQPLSVGVTLPLVARLKGARLVLNLQDLHPDAQIRLGMIRNRGLIRLLKAIEGRAYRSCAALTVICEDFRQHALRHGAAPGRVFVIENWVDAERIRPEPEGGRRFRRGLGIGDQDFAVLWAGTLGHVSGVDVVVEAAAVLSSNRRIRFVIVGEGPVKERSQARARELGLANVRFEPFQPESMLAAMQSSADVSLVTLAPTLAEVSVPSKVLAYFAAGRPVIAAVPQESETANLIRRAGAGVIVPAGDAAALAAAIAQLASDPESVARLGSAARSFAVEQLSATAAASRYAGLFQSLCEAG
jgi:colanic acid biosynthesis glycosyl transferase WcaI